MSESNFEWDEVKNLSNQKKQREKKEKEKKKRKRKRKRRRERKKKDTHFPKKEKKEEKGHPFSEREKGHPFFIHYLLLPLVKDWNVNTEYSQQPGIKDLDSADSLGWNAALNC